MYSIGTVNTYMAWHMTIWAETGGAEETHVESIYFSQIEERGIFWSIARPTCILLGELTNFREALATHHDHDSVVCIIKFLVWQRLPSIGTWEWLKTCKTKHPSIYRPKLSQSLFLALCERQLGLACGVSSMGRPICGIFFSASFFFFFCTRRRVACIGPRPRKLFPFLFPLLFSFFFFFLSFLFLFWF